MFALKVNHSITYHMIYESIKKVKYMKKNQDSLKDLKQLRKFLKFKNISLDCLSKEMDYSVGHVVKVFNGGCSVQNKFMRTVVKSIVNILQDDAKDFYKFMRDKSWSTFNCDSLSNFIE